MQSSKNYYSLHNFAIFKMDCRKNCCRFDCCCTCCVIFLLPPISVLLFTDKEKVIQPSESLNGEELKKKQSSKVYVFALINLLLTLLFYLPGLVHAIYIYHTYGKDVDEEDDTASTVILFLFLSHL